MKIWTNQLVTTEIELEDLPPDWVLKEVECVLCKKPAGLPGCVARMWKQYRVIYEYRHICLTCTISIEQLPVFKRMHITLSHLIGLANGYIVKLTNSNDPNDSIGII